MRCGKLVGSRQTQTDSQVDLVYFELQFPGIVRHKKKKEGSIEPARVLPSARPSAVCVRYCGCRARLTRLKFHFLFGVRGRFPFVVL